MRRLLRFSWRHPGLTLAALVVAGLLTMNGAIRLLGGGPHLLSPRFVPDKLAALAAYGRHLPRHFFGSCGRHRDRQLARAAKQHGVPVALVRSVAHVESRGASHSVSHAGAMGVMQLMPGTARQLGVADPFDAAANIDGGVRYLAWLWRRYDGDVHRVVAAYNAGPGRIPKRGGYAMPHETRRYVARVLDPSVCRALGRAPAKAPR